MSLEQSVKELAENFKKLTTSEKEELRSILGQEWFLVQSEDERLKINSLLKKSKDQLKRGKGKSAEKILHES